MTSDWVSFLAYPNLFGINGLVVVVDDNDDDAIDIDNLIPYLAQENK
jgi:hypothetical protein